jgi:hypothetical protein
MGTAVYRDEVDTWSRPRVVEVRVRDHMQSLPRLVSWQRFALGASHRLGSRRRVRSQNQPALENSRCSVDSDRSTLVHYAQCNLARQPSV